MSAAPTIAVVRATLLDRVADSPARARALDMLDAADAAPAAGTSARTWFAARHGRAVELLQATGNGEGAVARLWAPGPRTVDASRATYVTFDGSRRDYAGCRTLAASSDVLVLDTGDALAVYREVTR